VKLADFGVSSQLTSREKKNVTVVGTPYFMAPEVVQGISGYDSKADIWSLGISAIDMAQAEPPRFEIAPSKVIWMIPHYPPPTLKNPLSFSPTLNHFIAFTLVKDPVNRPTAEQLLGHPFITDDEKASGAFEDLIKEALDMIATVGSREVAIKQAKARMRQREQEARKTASQSPVIAPRVGTPPVESRKGAKKTPNGPVPLPHSKTEEKVVTEEDFERTRKKTDDKGKTGAFLVKAPSARRFH